jgi:hypothetical protein
METGAIISWVIYFIVSVIIAWIVLSLILQWFQPALYNADGSVNWWTTLWVAALVIIFAWILVLLIGWIISLFSTPGCNKCEHKCENTCNKCATKCDNVCGAVVKQNYGLFGF